MWHPASRTGSSPMPYGGQEGRAGQNYASPWLNLPCSPRDRVRHMGQGATGAPTSDMKRPLPASKDARRGAEQDKTWGSNRVEGGCTGTRGEEILSRVKEPCVQALEMRQENSSSVEVAVLIEGGVGRLLVGARGGAGAPPGGRERGWCSAWPPCRSQPTVAAGEGSIEHSNPPLFHLPACPVPSPGQPRWSALTWGGGGGGLAQPW